MILSHITSICLVYTAELGTKLFDMADHYVQNGNTHIYHVFQSPPKKSDWKLPKKRKKKRGTHQNKNNAQNKNHNQHQCQKMQL